jgi:diguanylate cyclase (GGDEF)-like protein/PAS domain S-box-containing protein
VTTLPHEDVAGVNPIGVLLLVEDDPDQAFLVRRRLRDQLPQGMEVVHLGTVTEAKARLADGDVCCVLLDLSLPDAKGLEAVSGIRAADPSVAIVVLTGTDSDELGRQAVSLGAQDYLIKGQHGADAVGRSVIFAIERTKRQAAEQSQALLADRLQLVLESSAEGICLLDGRGLLRFANTSASALLGMDADALVGRRLHDFHACASLDCDLATKLSSGMQTDAGEQVFRSLRGSASVLEVRARPLHDLNGGSVVNLTDVTARRQAEDALAEREAQLVEAQHLAHLGSWEWDLSGDQVRWSDEMFVVTGLSPEDVPTDGRAFDTYTALVPELDRHQVDELLFGWTADRGPVAVVHSLVRPDGRLRWVQCKASLSSDPSAAGLHVVGTVQDITEQKEAEDALAHQALHDGLTGLPNRALLLDRLDRALADPRRKTVAAVFMDLDRFKWVNDSMSHAAGDELLIAVSMRLRSLMRPSDTLARLGGDEFVLVCEQLTTEQQVFGIVERLNSELAQPFVIEGRDLLVTTSMGVALAPAGEVIEPEALIRDADTAMYRAKDNGRARYEIFDEDMRLRATQRLETQNDMPGAVVRGEIKAWFQPMIDLSTRKVIGCEALARWEHPTKGLLMPDAFVPLAEETGAIVELGVAVLGSACAQVACWNRGRRPDDQLSVSVNVSARQLSSPQLVDNVAKALRESGLPASLLCLEVTETVIMEDVAVSGHVLGQLRELGVSTAVDDFGTGYSSLAYLLSLPVDVLKVDRSFVQVLEEEGPALAIVRSIAALATALGLGVVAEGVETDAQLQLLARLGIEHGQGFLWGRAVPADQARWALPTVPVPATRLPIDSEMRSYR